MSDRERSNEPSPAPSHADGGDRARVDPTADIAAIYGDGAVGRRPRANGDGDAAQPAVSSGDGAARRLRTRSGGGGRHLPRFVSIDGGGDSSAPGPRPKLRWFRLLALLSGLGVLAAVSTVFGMMMAVASDLPEIDVLDVAPRQSTIVDRDGRQLGLLTGNQNRILVRSNQIAPVMKHAIVAIEDRRFYTHSGVDLRGIARALYQDIVARKAVQGGSTIAQQLVKNRLDAQNERTVFNKLREAAMAFHMTRQWDTERILRNYLNTIYFGNGAYGVESAARTYFGADFGLGTDTPQCGSARGQRRCAELLEPAQAALIAAVVASPSAYDPVANPRAATARRNLVLQRMAEQGLLSVEQMRRARAEPIPTPNDVQPPQVTSRYPYFTTWVRQQVVDKVGAGKAFEGGLRVQTTIDSELQDAAQAAVTQWLGPNAGRDGTPAAALVALDNRTSEVLAMVGGGPGGYNERPFNLATQGQRQPGSSFKPFILAEALEEGYGPTSTFTSARKEFCVVRRNGKCVEVFQVNNYDDAYAGVTSLANATAFSDNSVYAELGLKVGTKEVARTARRMGVRTPVSTNYAMTLGGLKQGVTVMDMAHAYESFASGGELVYGSLSPGAEGFEKRDRKGTAPGPVGIQSIEEPSGGKYRTTKLLDGEKADNRTRRERVLPETTARTVEELLQGVVRTGSGKRASLGPAIMTAGKTGTTEDYGDAWFVGWTPRYTVAVWVGYPDSVKPMKPPTFSFNGEPVAGGTYPAVIWSTFMRQAMDIYAREHPESQDAAPATTAPAAPVTTPSGEGGDATTTTEPETSAPAPTQPEAPAEDDVPDTPAVPEDSAPAEPAPQTPAPAGGGGAGDESGSGVGAGGESAPPG